MPSFEKAIIVKCDKDNHDLELDGGFVQDGSNGTSIMLIYVCPECQSVYINYNGEFLQNSYLVLSKEDAKEIEKEIIK